MSNYEIKSRFGPVEAFKWRFFCWETIVVDWPQQKEFCVDDTSEYWCDLGGAVKILITTDDPNFHYRPLLEKHVGKQGKDWMWRHVIGCNVFVDLAFHRQFDKIEIKIRKDKAKWASLLLLRWRNYGR